MFFVVTVIGVDEILPFSYLVFRVNGFHLYIVQRRLLKLLSQVGEGMLDVVAGALVSRIRRVASLIFRRDMGCFSGETHGVVWSML